MWWYLVTIHGYLWLISDFLLNKFYCISTQLLSGQQDTGVERGNLGQLLLPFLSFMSPISCRVGYQLSSEKRIISFFVARIFCQNPNPAQFIFEKGKIIDCIFSKKVLSIKIPIQLCFFYISENQNGIGSILILQK